MTLDDNITRAVLHLSHGTPPPVGFRTQVWCLVQLSARQDDLVHRGIAQLHSADGTS